jgi:hypothetical protein
MAIGRKTGGRRSGTPNRKSKEVGEILASLGCNPIEGMAKLAEKPEHTPELRGRMYAELAQYLYPKRRGIDLTADRDALTVTFLRQETIAQVVELPAGVRELLPATSKSTVCMKPPKAGLALAGRCHRS